MSLAFSAEDRSRFTATVFSERGYNPRLYLHHAIREGNLELVKWLLENVTQCHEIPNCLWFTADFIKTVKWLRAKNIPWNKHSNMEARIEVIERLAVKKARHSVLA